MSAFFTRGGRASFAALRTWLLAPLMALALSIAGCGGGDSNSVSASGTAGTQSCTSSSCGDVFISLTDADGDFLSYTVDVVSLTLKKANGAVVETVPNSTRVDFAQLVDLTEFFSAATIPNGTYVEGTLHLDYSNAEVTVEVNGEPKAATVVDENGQPLGTVDVQVVLDNRNHIVVAPGRPALLQLDFDLAETHTVDITQTPAQTSIIAVARPMIVATVEPVDEKEMRVRGPLVSVDTAASTYTIDVRPFLHRTARFGRLKVHTTSNTAFEIDGQTYTGSAGLSALAQLGVGSSTAAFGTFELQNRTFTAERVHAGTSVPGSNFDVIWGNVTSRSGDTLTVRGGTLIRRSGSVTFVRDDVTLLVGPDTGVTRDGQHGNNLGEDALSVGQRIHAFGQVSEGANGHLTIDAQQGRVRMHLTHLWGTVKSSVPGALTLDLDAIDGRRVSIFDFSGTGTASATDADPDNYEISTGALNLTLFPNDAPTRVFGFVTPFGLAPPDFEGRTLVDFANVRAVLGLGWGPNGTSAPFLSIEGTGITIDNENTAIGLRHYIAIGPRLIDITALASAPRIVPAGDRGLYAIGQTIDNRRRVEVFSDFAAFATKLSELLGAGNKALGMSATGSYDTAANTLSTREVHVTLVSAN